MVYGKLCALLAQQLGIDADRLTPQTNIVDDLGADSLDIVEFTTAIEDEFGIMIVDESVRQLYTIGELTHFIEDLVTA